MEIELDADATVARILNPHREPAPHHPLTDVLMRMMAEERARNALQKPKKKTAMPRKRRKLTEDVIEKIVDMYRNKGMTQSEIGKELKLAHMTVNYAIQERMSPQERAAIGARNTQRYYEEKAKGKRVDPREGKTRKTRK